MHMLTIYPIAEWAAALEGHGKETAAGVRARR